MATKPEFLVTKNEMLVALAAISVKILSIGIAFIILCLCNNCSLVKRKGPNWPFF